MNKFSPTSTSLRDPSTGKSTNEADFDFGDLVTMTIIDVFETDVNGKLLSYCPTFDNRAVHKTPEMAERIRKGASHLMERVEDVVNSPAGKSVNQVRRKKEVLYYESIGIPYCFSTFSCVCIRSNGYRMQAAGRLGKMSFRAAIVVGNAVKNKIQHNNRVPGSSTDEDALNELMTSQIAGDESMDINATYSSALDEDPVSSPSRYVAPMPCCRSYLSYDHYVLSCLPFSEFVFTPKKNGSLNRLVTSRSHVLVQFQHSHHTIQYPVIDDDWKVLQ